MIEAIGNIDGKINVTLNLTGTINKGKEYIEPLLQEKTATPIKAIQEITPDEGYNGLSKNYYKSNTK